MIFRINKMLFREGQQPACGRLRRRSIRSTLRDSFGSVFVPNLEDWKSQNTVFAGISAFVFASFNLEDGDTPGRRTTQVDPTVPHRTTPWLNTSGRVKIPLESESVKTVRQR